MKQHTYYTTRDYQKFDVFTFNRPLNEGLVKRLMKSIIKIGYVNGKPIIVDKTMAIIDGQHRFEACRRLEMDIIYVVSAVEAHEAIIELNTSQVHWKMHDFVHAWADKGISCYKHILEIQEKYKFGISNNIIICLDGAINNDQANRIRSGYKFQINPKAEEIINFILACNIVPYNKTSYFIKAVVKLFMIADKKQIKKIQDHIMALPQQATAADYIVAFENMVNRNVHRKNHISFKQT